MSSRTLFLPHLRSSGSLEPVSLPHVQHQNGRRSPVFRAASLSICYEHAHASNSLIPPAASYLFSTCSMQLTEALYQISNLTPREQRTLRVIPHLHIRPRLPTRARPMQSSFANARTNSSPLRLTLYFSPIRDCNATAARVMLIPTPSYLSAMD